MALYYGIGRYVSINTRKKNWGKGILAQISERLKVEFLGLRGFSERKQKNMCTFYEAWNMLEPNSVVATTDSLSNLAVATAELVEYAGNEDDTIRQLQLTNLADFPIVDEMPEQLRNALPDMQN